jgi:hypothetical protein
MLNKKISFAIGLAIIVSGAVLYFIGYQNWMLACDESACPVFNPILYVSILSFGVIWCLAVYVRGGLLPSQQ